MNATERPWLKVPTVELENMKKKLEVNWYFNTKEETEDLVGISIELKNRGEL